MKGYFGNERSVVVDGAKIILLANNSVLRFLKKALEQLVLFTNGVVLAFEQVLGIRTEVPLKSAIEQRINQLYVRAFLRFELTSQSTTKIAENAL